MSFDGQWTAVPITVSGTLTGNVPPGASWLRVELEYSFQTLESYTSCAMVVLGVETGNVPQFFVPTLPLTYTIAANLAQNYPICRAAFQLKVYATNANYDQLSSAVTVPCGTIGGCPPSQNFTCGGPKITSSSVICNVSLP